MTTNTEYPVYIAFHWDRPGKDIYGVAAMRLRARCAELGIEFDVSER